MCSQLQHGVQSRRSFLWTVSSNSLQRCRDSMHWGHYRWVHLCRLSCDTVRRNNLLGCTPCWSWEQMSSWQCFSHWSCLAVVSNTAFIGDITVEYAQLWAHLCRLPLDTVRRNDFVGCTPCWSWEQMSSWQCLSHCPCLAVVSTTAFIGGHYRWVQLWAHLCTLSLDTVRRNDLWGCTPCWSWERMSNWQCLSHCFCSAVVTSLGIWASSIAVSPDLQTVAWHSPQKWSSELYTMLKLRAHVKLTVS